MNRKPCRRENLIKIFNVFFKITNRRFRNVTVEVSFNLYGVYRVLNRDKSLSGLIEQAHSLKNLIQKTFFAYVHRYYRWFLKFSKTNVG